MAFNIGVGGLKKFKKFNAAMTAKDYAKAATESNRTGIQVSRNEYVKALLNKAATKVINP